MKMVESVGFCFVGSSEINVNLKDDVDYEGGVWVLLLIYLNKDKDCVKYEVIGESDCMILKFFKF